MTLGAEGVIAPPPPDFGRIEGAAGQWQRVPLLLAHPDFQTLRHPWLKVAIYDHLGKIKYLDKECGNIH